MRKNNLVNNQVNSKVHKKKTVTKRASKKYNKKTKKIYNGGTPGTPSKVHVDNIKYKPAISGTPYEQIDNSSSLSNSSSEETIDLTALHLKTIKPHTIKTDNLTTIQQQYSPNTKFTLNVEYILQDIFNNTGRTKQISGTSNSASGSTVYLYTDEIVKGGKPSYRYYVVKNTVPHKRKILNHVITESNIYMFLNLMKYLKASSHFYTSYDRREIVENSKTKSFVIFNETQSLNIEPSYLQITSLYNFLYNNTQYIILNQPSMNIKQYTNNFFTVIKIILFQLLYSLECMARLKVKHNDLHSGNILIEYNEKLFYQFLNDGKVKKYTKYTVTKRPENLYFGTPKYNDNVKAKTNGYNKTDVYLPDISLQIKIYDFDRSVVYDLENNPIIYDEKFYNSHNNKYRYVDYMENINTIPTDNLDSLKILTSIYGIIARFSYIISKQQNVNISSELRKISELSEPIPKDNFTELFANLLGDVFGITDNGTLNLEKFKDYTIFNEYYYIVVNNANTKNIDDYYTGSTYCLLVKGLNEGGIFHEFTTNPKGLGKLTISKKIRRTLKTIVGRKSGVISQSYSSYSTDNILKFYTQEMVDILAKYNPSTTNKQNFYEFLKSSISQAKYNTTSSINNNNYNNNNNNRSTPIQVNKLMRKISISAIPRSNSKLELKNTLIESNLATKLLVSIKKQSIDDIKRITVTEYTGNENTNTE